ncbi:MAG: DUF2207 domain-containing protein [Bacteroidetes bacterium]|nr:DUF2207 domain-containing protein [Bacteroidota bacterium]
MKRLFLFVLICFFAVPALAQEYFTISKYDVSVLVNKDASLDITETINVHFTSSRHGIFRMIPYEYRLQQLPSGTQKADRQLESNGYAHTIIEDISVEGWNYTVSNTGGYKQIKIGDKNRYVDGDQQYVIHYRMLNAINFFKDHSELYFNIVGDKWDTQIDHVHFTVSLYNTLPGTPDYFVATGAQGSTDNNTATKWEDNKTLSGSTTAQLSNHEGVTVGIKFPNDFLTKPNYMLRGMKWLIFPVIVFILMFFTWNRWGKDDKLTITTEFYPPKDVSPSVAGYVIDDRLDKRDLTALVPYWGAGGYLKIEETENSSFLGLVHNKEYTFIKLKDLPASTPLFERTLFEGIFDSGDRVALSSLKDVLYKTMETAKRQLESEIDRGAYYVKNSRGLGYFFCFIGLASGAYGIYHLIKYWGDPYWMPLAFIASAIIFFAFGAFMSKKTEKGNQLYQKLAGFKEFIKSVEQDRLALFLKQDENYFDIVLPFAIVFDVADQWKDKLKGLDIPPPNWYSGSYGSNFSTYMFLSSLDQSMNKMTENFYSAPSSSGSSGGSWGGGGFSGGGFGGGGGGSW